RPSTAQVWSAGFNHDGLAELRAIKVQPPEGEKRTEVLCLLEDRRPKPGRLAKDDSGETRRALEGRLAEPSDISEGRPIQACPTAECRFAKIGVAMEAHPGEPCLAH